MSEQQPLLCTRCNKPLKDHRSDVDLGRLCEDGEPASVDMERT